MGHYPPHPRLGIHATGGPAKQPPHPRPISGHAEPRGRRHPRPPIRSGTAAPFRQWGQTPILRRFPNFRQGITTSGRWSNRSVVANPHRTNAASSWSETPR